ncbi:DUF4160 domain-containing protein [Actinoplanes friuliensis]|uniref:DUF4160 domain-containing protein n=1 Tax=Actinoplanes friuliensis TaxID=196914 RepID=UPI000A06E81F
MSTMPRLGFVDGSPRFEAYMYSEDHMPPHFHAIRAEGNAGIKISSGDRMKFKGLEPSSKCYKRIEGWRRKNISLLRKEWGNVITNS